MLLHFLLQLTKCPFLPELEDVRSANEHFLRIRTTARCRVPRTRVVHVKEFYSDPSKEYLPRCTVLHRCGDDSGCCDNEQYECVPRTMQEVTLHFYVRMHLMYRPVSLSQGAL